ncbi:hypothetical protein PLICRDRAFT_179321 [Plicaturopsis crispa FD-325 SS-3]|uniref:Uncharacterized protein n=1 Tax=Plicaturopsis crispa FD-325 SS-3 TaxID=944288 RepID=A0A0C9T8F8_PLICR|nr:hypothetical protein PLICRDRAFT_179321 [Plicaturopsis crispa FD-325 SS-3]
MSSSRNSTPPPPPPDSVIDPSLLSPSSRFVLQTKCAHADRQINEDHDDTNNTNNNNENAEFNPFISLQEFGRLVKRHKKLSPESEADFDNFCQSVRLSTWPCYTRVFCKSVIYSGNN